MNATWGRDAGHAIADLPSALQETTRRRLERLVTACPGSVIDEKRVGSLVRLLAASDFAASVLQREWPEIEARGDAFWTHPVAAELDELVETVEASDDSDAAGEHLRRFRNRYLLRLLNREVEGAADLTETLRGLSDLADRSLDAAVRFAVRQLRARFGDVRNRQGAVVPLVVLGMGKLGGNELNFSSDIDIIFLYPGSGETDGPKSISASEYFTRLAQRVVTLLEKATSDGFVFRVDTRLRPFGDSGPPVISFAALETYLVQHGRGWERYAYVKARIVGPRVPAEIESELFDEMITPFVYRSYLDFGVFEALREMKSLIAAEVQRRELADNVKLGPGGIREIEFIVQSLQLVRGGSRPELQDHSLLAVLPRLAGRRGLAEHETRELHAAYCFLRRLENFIQALRDHQLHELPKSDEERQRLCVAMGFASWNALLKELNRHRTAVTQSFERVAFHDSAGEQSLQNRPDFEALWDRMAPVEAWAELLGEEGFTAAGQLAEVLSAFASAPATQRIDEPSRLRLRRFLPLLLMQLRPLSDPAIVLQRVIAIVEEVLRRSAYLALLNENVSALERLVRLVAQSDYIARQIARYPVLLDELLDPRINFARPTRSELDRDLDKQLRAASGLDSEGQIELLGRFQRASRFRIAVADFNGTLPVMRVSDSLTDLAETVLSHALQIAWTDMKDRHGVPRFRVDGQLRRAGFGIIAYGKFGGIELSYSSDLDLVFLHDSQGEQQETDGKKPIANTVFFTRLVRRLVHYLTTQTGSGALYEIDMRLRPDGSSGLLVTSVEAFEHYQEGNAWTWEHQALLRARPVAGSGLIAREFERIRVETLTQRVHGETLREDVLSMRARMRKQLDESSASQFDLKQGRGGIADIEFIVQYLVLAHASDQRAVVHYTDNIRQLATLMSTGCLEAGRAAGLQEIYRRYRERLHHLALDGRPAMVAAREFEKEQGQVAALWKAVFDGDNA